jgi:hypothetical protein
MTSSPAHFAALAGLFESTGGFAILGLLFWIWMIFECLKREKPGSMQKILWLLLVILVPDFGALIYFLCRVVR